MIRLLNNYKFRFLIFLIILNILILKSIYNFDIINESIINKKLTDEISIKYNKFNKVNINQIDNEINNKKELIENIKSTINIGATLDINFVLETMITACSIMATQNKNTKIRFHFGVTNNFTAEKMLKIYKLRNKINNLTEFNFYYLKESVVKMKNFHKTKGETCPGKFELPLYLPEDVERLLVFDVGDLLVFRDLTDLYNYDMGEYWVIGTAEPSIIESFMKVKYNITKYLNVGSLLMNVKKLKENNFWENFTKHRYINLTGQPEQTLLNIIIPDNKKNYIPFKFGGYTLFFGDKESDNLKFANYNFKSWFSSNLSQSLPEDPKSEAGIALNLYNSRFIHQFYGKWKNGQGLSIYRLLAKYFILLTGISDEICMRKPGYCI